MLDNVLLELEQLPPVNLMATSPRDILGVDPIRAGLDTAHIRLESGVVGTFRQVASRLQ